MKGQQEKLHATVKKLLEIADSEKFNTTPKPEEWSTAASKWRELSKKRSISPDEMAELERLVEDAEKACATV